MSSLAFSILFIAFLFLNLTLQFWLGSRQIRHVLRYRETVPAEFAEKISLAAHQKAANYTVAKSRLGMVMLTINNIVLIGFTLLGGLQLLTHVLHGWFGHGMALQIGLIAAFVFISSMIELPFDYYRQFVLEERFGFNKMTPGLFFADLFKSALLGAVIGLPMVWVVLSLMQRAGDAWWVYAWLALSGFQLLMMVLFPTVIAPLFNKFTPLENADLKTRIENLIARTGFASKGLFVMDGSRRSAHGNAYFSGFGAAKRIVFYDTLIERLSPAEIEAVLAHELGHFKLKHITKRIVIMFAMSFGFLALLGYLKEQVWFYTGLGVEPTLFGNDNAMSLILFMLALPVFTFVFSPLTSLHSRKHEFEADAFAARYTAAADLVSALVRLYEDNASTLTPDPLHSTFYDSHPPASIRIHHLLEKTS